jgi:predicted amidohydrolase YtcJ
MTSDSFVFVGGRVATMVRGRPWADAVVVQGGRIAYVGDESGAREHAPAGAEVVDLGGGVLIPGFVDAHDHLTSLAGVLNAGVNLNGIAEPQALLDAIEAYAKANPDLAVIRGKGFLPTTFPGMSARREMLDAIVPDRPVAILSFDIHDCWFNTAAMTAAGIDRSTPDPDPGSQYFVRDADGTPTGYCLEGANVVVLGGLGEFEVDRNRDLQRLTLDPAPSWGITTMFEAGVILGRNVDAEPVYAELVERDHRGELPIRISGTFWSREATDDPQELVAHLRDWNARYRSENLSISTLKIWSDGTMLSGGSLLLEPYEDDPHSCGHMHIPGPEITGMIEATHVAGFDVHVHVEGDGSLRTVLDAIEQVQARHGRGDRRHTVCHNTWVHPDDLHRFVDLGIVANVTPMWGTDFDGGTMDAYTARMGEHRVRTRSMPYGDLVRSGAVVTYGADCPGVRIEEIPPLTQIEAAVTRRRPGHPEDRAYLPDQRVSVHDAVRAYTANGAYQLHLEDEIGTIEVGKRADLVALGADLFAVPDHEIHQVPVLQTLFGGRVTHDAR